MSARAGIVVTGTEVLTGRVSDLNGPWLAEQLRQAGVDVGFTVVVGDRPQDLVDVLDFLAGAAVDLVVTSGGLGPTADDLTAGVVGDWQGRPSSPDPDLEARIAAIVERLSARRGWTVDADAMAAGTAKQALVPEGAEVLEPTGTAPGLVVPAGAGRDHPPVVVLPGPPSELQAMWPAAVASSLVGAALSGRAELRQATLRLWGTPEAAIAATLRRLEGDLDGLEITTCLRGGELEVVTRYGVDLEERYQRLVDAVRDEYAAALFSTDGSTVDDLVAGLLGDRGLTIATAESCTAGLLAGRLTERAGSSAWVRGGVVVYSDEAKHDLAGVPTELIARHGAVSEQVAAALADGARQRLGADVGVGITGIAGPGGGTADKPVGLVHLCVSGPDGRIGRAPVLPGDRSRVRERSVSEALHLVRELLQTRELTIATAESCTAGLLAGRLTDRAGSSAWVRGGVVAYSNEAKHDLVGVPTDMIERHGAVSEEVAVALADGARRQLGADIGVGITGVAGPGGGTAEKPVGLVHICVAGPGGHLTRAPVLPGGRSQVRARSVTFALHLVREALQNG